MSDRRPPSSRSRSSSPRPAGSGGYAIARDLILSTLGIFMLVHETLSGSPQPLIVGAGLVLLGLPPALRLDEILRRP